MSIYNPISDYETKEIVYGFKNHKHMYHVNHYNRYTKQIGKYGKIIDIVQRNNKFNFIVEFDNGKIEERSSDSLCMRPGQSKYSSTTDMYGQELRVGDFVVIPVTVFTAQSDKKISIAEITEILIDGGTSYGVNCKTKVWHGVPIKTSNVRPSHCIKLVSDKQELVLLKLQHG